MSPYAKEYLMPYKDIFPRIKTLSQPARCTSQQARFVSRELRCTSRLLRLTFLPKSNHFSQYAKWFRLPSLSSLLRIYNI